MYYLQSRYYDPEVGRFINADGMMGASSGMSTYNLFVYCGNNPVVRCDCAGTSWKDCISGIIHAGHAFLLYIGIDTATIGAFFLNMRADSSGVYHASFNCWQQYFGYNELYDIVFDIGTSMEAAEFPFFYNGMDYTIWVWKGDYINLGAGAELGIYRGSSGHRTVDKSLRMAMCVAYDQSVIIDYAPSQYQWWITGFNPAYQNVNANDLTASFLIRFRSSGMYQAFKDIWGVDSRWTFYDGYNTAVFTF